MTAGQLIAFEQDIASEFNAAKIRAPIHLDGGNEAPLINIFSTIRREDWVCCTWRSHYKALLHGVPPDKVKKEIMAGRSISLCFPEYRVISSAIVGGILPIALGIAWSIQRNDGRNHVFVFVGDMAARGGMFHECSNYAACHGLPITFVVEDNGLSVCTPTRDVWGRPAQIPKVDIFSYKLPWPHSGAGRRVEF